MNEKTYEEAKTYRGKIDEKLDESIKILDTFEKSPNGLTPDSIRALPEWKKAKKESDLAFAELREFNGWFVKKFKKEIRQERDNRYKSITK